MRFDPPKESTYEKVPRGLTAIDSHAHLSFETFEPVSDIVTRAQDYGIQKIISIGAGEGLEGNSKTATLLDEFENVYASFGCHPHDAKLYDDNFKSALETWLVLDKCVALGETGLDFHYMLSSREKQLQAFAEQLDIALRCDLPVVIHSREAHAEICNTLKPFMQKTKQTSIIHCFSEGEEEARNYLDLGCMLSFLGIITFPKAENVRDAAKIYPNDPMLIETDAPFLAPKPFRGKQNEPAFCLCVLAFLADLLGLPAQELSRMTITNTLKTFKRLPAATQ